MDEIVPIVTSCIAAVISIITLFYLSSQAEGRQ